jgi:hypothetical protein
MKVIRGLETDIGSSERRLGSHRAPGVGGDQCQTTLPWASASATAPGTEQFSKLGMPHGLLPLLRNAVVKTTCTEVALRRRCETETPTTTLELEHIGVVSASTGFPPVTLDGGS